VSASSDSGDDAGVGEADEKVDWVERVSFVGAVSDHEEGIKALGGHSGRSLVEYCMSSSLSASIYLWSPENVPHRASLPPPATPNQRR
jgi:hypothetical protein